MALAIRLGGTHEAVLRLVPAVLSTAAVPLVVLIQRELALQSSGGQRQGWAGEVTPLPVAWF